jgi:hypothetical protein
MVFTSTSDPDTNRVWNRAQSGLWIRFPIVNSRLDPDRLKWPIKKKKNEEIHVVTCRMFSYKGWRLLHGGQRIDFFKPKNLDLDQNSPKSPYPDSMNMDPQQWDFTCVF